MEKATLNISTIDLDKELMVLLKIHNDNNPLDGLNKLKALYQEYVNKNQDLFLESISNLIYRMNEKILSLEKRNLDLLLTKQAMVTETKRFLGRAMISIDLYGGNNEI